MKKMKWKALFFLGLGMLSLSSCVLQEETTTTNSQQYTVTVHPSDDSYSVPVPEAKGDYTVLFVLNNGYSYESYTNKENMVIEPTTPEKKCATFLGWYKDKECTSLYTFRKAATQNLILYAKWEINYIELYNELNTKMILSNVRIQVDNYDISGFNRKINENNSLGSGVIFDEDENYYYALTNNHVIYTKTKYQDIVLEDAYEHAYSCEIVDQRNTYDLAILRFRKYQPLTVVEFADYTLEEGELVYALGEPKGLSNTITSGKILGTKIFQPSEDEKEMSNVTFSVYRNSAPIENGSSGGALLDSNLKLVGINFASAIDTSTNTYKYAYTIPIEKVREFLNLTFYKKTES